MTHCDLVWFMPRSCPMCGSATLTMETSSTTMNCATQAMERMSQSGVWRWVVVAGDDMGFSVREACIILTLDAPYEGSDCPKCERLGTWLLSSSSPCAICAVSTPRTARY